MNFDSVQSADQIKDLRAQVQAARDQYNVIVDRYQAFKMNFGLKERGDGTIDIDYDKFVDRLGSEAWAHLRAIGDAKHGASGAAPAAVAASDPAAVLAPLVGQTVTILASENGKPKLRIHAKAKRGRPRKTAA